MFFTGIKGMKRTAKSNIPAAKFFSDTLSTITKWFIDGDDDILKALLYHYQDSTVLKYMGYYKKLLSVPLFLYALEHGNREFM